MDVRVGLWRKLSTEELMLLNYGVREDSWVPWTARRSNQSILKEISPGCSLEGKNAAKAETPALWPPHEKSWLIGKDSDAGRDWDAFALGTSWAAAGSLTLAWTFLAAGHCQKVRNGCALLPKASLTKDCCVQQLFTEDWGPCMAWAVLKRFLRIWGSQIWRYIRNTWESYKSQIAGP